jgi:methionyl-tRNA synthetase
MACRPELKVCFGCERVFDESEAKYCDKCTEWKCPHCETCGCKVSPETLKAIRAIVKTYELWLEDKCKA